MSDYRIPDDTESMRLVALKVMEEMRCALPGRIERFDPETNLAEVIPLIERKDVIRGEVKYVRLPIIVNVPVVVMYAQTQGLCITIPIKKGDECLLVFSDAFLDNFIERGGFGPPEAVGPNNTHTKPRIHHLADAICIPGLSSQPNRIPDWNTENIEIRDMERKVYTSLGANGIESTDGEAKTHITGGTVTAEAPNGATITDTQAVWEMKDGHLSVTAPNGIDIEAPNFRIKSSDGYGWTSGTFRAEELETDAGFAANSHRHSGVETGGGTTGTFV